MNGYLLDTNVVSEFIRPRPEPRVVEWMRGIDEDGTFLSVLTLGELAKGIALLADEQARRRERLRRWLDGELRPRFAGRIIPVDENVAEQWGTISAAAERAGAPVPVVDGIMAATALAYDLVFVTRNVRDVARTGAAMFDPWGD